MKHSQSHATVTNLDDADDAAPKSAPRLRVQPPVTAAITGRPATPRRTIRPTSTHEIADVVRDIKRSPRAMRCALRRDIVSTLQVEAVRAYVCDVRFFTTTSASDTTIVVPSLATVVAAIRVVRAGGGR